MTYNVDALSDQCANIQCMDRSYAGLRMGLRHHFGSQLNGGCSGSLWSLDRAVAVIVREERSPNLYDLNVQACKPGHNHGVRIPLHCATSTDTTLS